MPRPDRHRAAIVASAARLLRRRGYHATGLTDVLYDASATNGSLYHHFPGGKQDLARAALEASGEQIDAALALALRRAPDVAAAVTGWIDALIAQLEGNPLDGCPVAPAAIEAVAVSDDLRETAAAAFDRWTATLRDALAREMDPGEADVRAHVLMSAMEGALLLDRTARGTEHLRAVRSRVGALVGA